MARRGTGLRARTLAATEMVIVRSKASKQAGHVQTGLIAPQNDGPIQLVADTGHDGLAESEWYRSSPCRGKENSSSLGCNCVWQQRRRQAQPFARASTAHICFGIAVHLVVTSRRPRTSRSECQFSVLLRPCSGNGVSQATISETSRLAGAAIGASLRVHYATKERTLVCQSGRLLMQGLGTLQAVRS
jgi:hypothetical protein